MEIWPPRDTICIGNNLHWFKIWQSGSTSCIGWKFGHHVHVHHLHVHLVQITMSNMSMLYYNILKHLKPPGNTWPHLVPPGITWHHHHVHVHHLHVHQASSITWHHLARVYKCFWCLSFLAYYRPLPPGTTWYNLAPPDITCHHLL